MRSIAMASYQGMPFIRKQMDSILVQLSADDELVISDNGSTDGTLPYLLQMAQKDTRIRVFTLAGPKGVVPNFQNALEQCRGELIFLCDQDDIWMENKLDIISRLFAGNPKLLAVQSDSELIDSQDQMIAPSFFAYRHCGPGIWKNFRKNTWQGCNMAFRREILELALPFPHLIPMHDMWIGILSELCGEVQFLPAVLAQYRRHTDNISAMKRAKWSTVLRWRIHLAFAIFQKMPQIRKYSQALSHRPV